MGEYDNFKCGIRVHNIVPEDSGLWMCYLRAREGIQIAGMAFQVTVTTEDGTDFAKIVVGSIVGVVVLILGSIAAYIVCIKILKKSTKKVVKYSFRKCKLLNIFNISFRKGGKQPWFQG